VFLLAGEDLVGVVEEGLEYVENDLPVVLRIDWQERVVFDVLNVAEVEALLLVVRTELLIRRRQHHLPHLLVCANVQKYFAEPERAQFELVDELCLFGVGVGLAKVQEVLVGEVEGCVELEEEHFDVAFGFGGGDGEVVCAEQDCAVHNNLYCSEGEADFHG